MSPVRVFIFATLCSLYVSGSSESRDSEHHHHHHHHHKMKIPIYFKHRIEYNDFSFGSDEESKDDEKEHDFSYERDDKRKGPFHWGRYWNECKGKHQSPIDLNVKKSIFAPFKIKFSDETQAFNGVFVNNGHAPTFQLKDKGSILTGVPGRPYDEFVLIQFHFHFGMTNDHGSEHSLNHNFHAGEMHMVHYNLKYQSFDEAASKPDGLAVVAVFLDETYKDLDDFDIFVEKYGKDIITPSGSGIPTSFNPFTIIPKYRFALSYQGSLTTPACHESVMWIVMRESRPIHHNTLITFRELKTKNPRHTIAEYTNDRPIQPLHNRVILRNFKIRSFDRYIYQRGRNTY